MNSVSISGGSWCNFASRLRAFDRDSYSSDYWGFNQGFRVACETEPEDNREMCIRSSSWSSSRGPLRTTTRLSSGYIARHFSRFQFGFRVACEAPECQILRGGSWSSYPFHIHASLRFRIVPDIQDLNIGFRVACEEVE